MSHIAFLIPGLDRIAGAEAQLLLLAEGLSQRGHRISVIAMSGEGDVAGRQLAACGCEFVALRMRKGWADPRGWLRLAQWLRQQQPEVVHCHLPHAIWLGRCSRWLAPRRVQIDTLHTTAVGPDSRQRAFRWTEFLSDQVTAVSDAVRASQLGHSVSCRQDFIVLPNAVDLERWAAGTEKRLRQRAAFKISDEEFLWIAAGRLEAVKDYPTLLNAFATLPTRARLLIAGSGPLAEALGRQIESLELTGRVALLGQRSDLADLLPAADGFVQASLWEGMPMSLLEAGAVELPVVATNLPSIAGVVLDKETGFLAEPSHQESLAAAMRAMMEVPPEERASFGQRARRLISENYALARILDRWEALYGALLADHPRPTRRGHARNNAASRLRSERPRMRP